VAAVEERAVAGHTISIVVPVYQGEHTLDTLVGELIPLTKDCWTPQGRPMRVAEVILVHDGGPDRSDVVIRRLVSTVPFVRAVWLSRNFGQHAAAIAGMSSTGSEWIVTMDEDGQFDPNDIGRLLDVALADGVQLVYGTAKVPPHGWLRNLGSRVAKTTATLVLAHGSLIKSAASGSCWGKSVGVPPHTWDQGYISTPHSAGRSDVPPLAQFSLGRAPIVRRVIRSENFCRISGSS